MNPWIISLIVSIVAFIIIRQYRNSNADKYPEWSLASQIGVFGVIFLVAIALTHFFTDSNVVTSALSGGDLEADMLTRIHQDVHVGLPPF